MKKLFTALLLIGFSFNSLANTDSDSDSDIHLSGSKAREMYKFLGSINVNPMKASSMIGLKILNVKCLVDAKNPVDTEKSHNKGGSSCTYTEGDSTEQTKKLTHINASKMISLLKKAGIQMEPQGSKIAYEADLILCIQRSNISKAPVYTCQIDVD